MNKSTIAVVLVLSLVVGFALGFWQGKQSATNRFQVQIDKAKEFFPETLDIFFISGVVKEIDGNVLTVETPPSPNPFEELPTVREVVVGDDTEIIKREQKDPEVFDREFAAYERVLNQAQRQLDPMAPAPTDLPALPDLFEEKDITLDDLKVGDQVFVDAGENIKTKVRFEATRIVVQTAAAADLPPDILAPVAP